MVHPGGCYGRLQGFCGLPQSTQRVKVLLVRRSGAAAAVHVDRSTAAVRLELGRPTTARDTRLSLARRR